MRHTLSLLTLGLITAAALGSLVHAQTPSSSLPDWAYGFAPGEVVAGRGNGVQGPQPGGPPAPGRGGQDPNAILHVPGSNQGFSRGQITNFFDVADWFPQDHPAPPSVVMRGWAPAVRACGLCHLPNGKGRPENSPVSGQPYSYILQQLQDFRSDLRTSADPRKGNTALMIEGAKGMTNEEMRAAAAYFASIKWTPWIRVVERDRVPRTQLVGNVFIPIPDGGSEPIGRRIIESPEDAERFDLRDPRSGFVAYVPVGSVARGAGLASGVGGGMPRLTCHGPDLNGLGPVPGIAGRSPSYLVRQMWDMKQGARHGEWSALMKPIVTNLDQDDMLDLGAYLASLGSRP